MTKTQEIGNRVKLLMEQNSISQRDLAKRVKVSEPAISYIINGQRMPRIETINALAEALYTTVDFLLGNDPTNQDEIIRVPVFKEIKYNDKMDASNPNIIRWIPLAAERFANCNTLFFKEVVTDEMNPLLSKGDLVLFEIIRPGIDKIYTGDICLCTKGDENAVIREMVNTDSGYVFNLMNVNMPPIPRTLKNIKEEDINIVAKALEFVHIFPYRGPVNE